MRVYVFICYASISTSLYKCNACIWALYPFDVLELEKKEVLRARKREKRLLLFFCSRFRNFALSLSPPLSTTCRLFITISHLYFLANIYSTFDVLTLLAVCWCVCMRMFLYVGIILMISPEIEEAISQHEWYLRISVKVFRIDFDFCEKHFGQKLH